MQRESKLGKPFDLVQIQAKLDQRPEKRVWRGLEELAGTPGYRDFLACEFPHDPRADAKGVSRRSALKLMAASAAFAGLTACTKLPTEKIVPYAQQQPEDFIPGKPLFYATAMPMAGYATGLLVESHMGRPTKVEGNPSHPASLGAANVFAQASVLSLYDPDRAQVVIYDGRIGDWSAFLTSMDENRAELLTRKGAGLRILTGTVTSPALADQIRGVLAQYPQAKWHQYEPGSRDAVHEGARLAFGEYVNTVYHFDRAEVIVSLDADFLSTGPGAVRYARDFANKRRVTGPESTMNRLYVVESTPTVTGAMADHRLPMRASDVVLFARGLAARLEAGTGPAGATHGDVGGRRSRRWGSKTGYRVIGWPADWISASRSRSPKASRRMSRDCRRATAACRPRLGPRHERRLGQRGQNRALHGRRGSEPGERPGIAQGTGRRHAGRPG